MNREITATAMPDQPDESICSMLAVQVPVTLHTPGNSLYKIRVADIPKRPVWQGFDITVFDHPGGYQRQIDLCLHFFQCLIECGSIARQAR